MIVNSDFHLNSMKQASERINSQQVKIHKEKSSKLVLKDRLLIMLCVLEIVGTAAAVWPMIVDEEVRVSLQASVLRPQQLNVDNHVSEANLDEIFDKYSGSLSATSKSEWDELVNRHMSISSVLYEQSDQKKTFETFTSEYFSNIQKYSKLADIPLEVALHALANTPVGLDERDDIQMVVQEDVGAYARFYHLNDYVVKTIASIGLPDAVRIFNNMSLGQLDVEPIIMADGMSKAPKLVERLQEINPEVSLKLKELMTESNTLESEKAVLTTQIKEYVKNHPTALKAFWDESTRFKALKQIGIIPDNLDVWYLSHFTMLFWSTMVDKNTGETAIIKAMEAYPKDDRDVQFLSDVALSPGANIWDYLKQNATDEDSKEIDRIKDIVSKIRLKDEKYILYERKATLAISKNESNPELSVLLAMLSISHWNRYAFEHFGVYENLSVDKQREYLTHITNFVEQNMLLYGQSQALENFGLSSDLPYTPEAIIKEIPKS
jgi:hypothetical protein